MCGQATTARTVPRLAYLPSDPMNDIPSRLRPRRPSDSLSPDCDRARVSLSAFVDDEVDATEGAWVRSHIEQCERCGNAERGLRLLLAALRGTEIPVLAPRTLRLRVEQQFIDARQQG